jgi:FtsP/CotA-like multicopper oxidase with cupredoxin domain
MKHSALLSTALFAAIAASACGGGDSAASQTETAPAEASTPAAEPAAEAPQEMTMPDWYRMDGNTVTLDITAGATPDQNYWNFNGFLGGRGSITVPAGSRVVINFQNDDPNMAHSVGIEEYRDSWIGIIEVGPVFEGAVSSNPGSLTEATLPGESEVIEFDASTPGTYAMVCYIPGHAQIGMWVTFIVSEDGSAGVIM